MNKNEFLGVLYHYRERIIEWYSKPGWNKWALFGSLAAILWLLLCLLKDETFHLSIGIPLLFMLIIVSPLLRFLPTSSNVKYHTSKTTYLSIRQDLSEDLYSTLYNFSTLGFVMVYTNTALELPKPFLSVLNFYSGTILFCLILVLIFSQFNFHSPNVEGNENKLIKITRIFAEFAILIMGGISVFGYAKLINNWQDYSMWQSGFILFGIYFIIQKIVEEFEGNPSLDSINDLIDAVTFDRITIPEAEGQLKLIWFGAEFKDIIAPLIADFIQANDKFQSLVIDTKEKCEQYFKIDPKHRLAQEETIKSNIIEATKAEHNLAKKVKKINLKLVSFRYFEKENQDYRQIVETLNLSLAKSNTVVEELKSFVAENEAKEEAKKLLTTENQ